jgi:UDP-glucuronate 4-epimerase
VTGGAGFIGSHLVDELLEEGWTVTIVDNFDSFYDPAIKRANTAAHRNYANYRIVEADIRNASVLEEKLDDDYDVIVHLAAKAGVRPSIEDPLTYQEVNVNGTQNLLEFAKERGIQQFVFGSSSSVYGTNPDVPWQEDDSVLRPISPYASSKVSGELLGHVYSELYDIRFIALRFFTVYGPRQRPDLAIHKFARLMLEDEVIPVYGDGSTRRDYTYVGDIVEGIRAAMSYKDTSYEVINLGNNRTVRLSELIETIEEVLALQAKRNHLPEQPGDVPQTWADISRAQALLDYQPSTKLQDGLETFRDWLGKKHLALDL